MLVVKNFNELDWLAGVFVGLLATFSILFPEIAIGPSGIAVLFFLILALYLFACVSLFPNIAIDKNLRSIILWYLLFSLILAFAFFITGSTSLSDLYYLTVTVSNILWVIFFVILYQKNSSIFHSFVLTFSVLVPVMIIAIWLCGLVVTSDFFYLRHDTLDMKYIDHTLFKNPNLTARNAATILPLILFVFLSTSQSSTRFLVKSMLLGLGVVILSTLSRANFITLFVFSVGFIIVYRYALGSTQKIHWKSSLIFALIFVIITVTVSPTLQERIASIGKISSQTWSVLVDDEAHFLPKRTRTWHATGMIIFNNPLFGIGASREMEYQEKYGGVSYSGDKEKVSPIAIHGGFLKIAAYGGVLCAFVFIMFLYKLYRYAKYKIGISNADSNEKYAAFSLALLIVMLVPMNIGANSFGMPLTWIVIGVLLAYVCGKTQSKSHSSTGSNTYAVSSNMRK